MSLSLVILFDLISDKLLLLLVLAAASWTSHYNKKGTKIQSFFTF